MSIKQSRISLAEKLFNQGKLEDALSVCIEHLQACPSDIVATRLKAKVQGMRDDLQGAIDSITEVIDCSQFLEPCDFFYRGRWRLRIGETAIACTDFEKILELSEAYGDGYYSEAAHLHLAYANAMIGNRQEAEEHLMHMGDDSVTSIKGSVINADYIRKLLGIKGVS